MENGEDRWSYNSDDNIAKVCLGKSLEIPSRQTEMRHRRDPSEKDHAYQSRAVNKTERKEAATQRREAYRSLPTVKGMVNDHKGIH